MFSSVPLAFCGSSVPDSNTESSRLIAAIQNQTDGTPPHMVYVLDIVSVKFGGYFTAEVRAELERYRYLQMLTLNDCGIVSLENFPNLPALIRLDMVFNEIGGEHLQHLSPSKHLQTVMLGANRVAKIEHLHVFKGMRQLLQLDLINNPIQKVPGYRETVFSMFPNLSILDTLDKGGKDAYTNSTMLEAVSRVPDGLFDKTIPPPPIHHPVVHAKQASKLKKALARTGSLDSISVPIKKVTKTKPSKRGGKSKISVLAGRSKSSKSGLLFPVGRIKRKLKEVMVGQRVGVNGAIYMAAILEYLTAELVEIAGNEAVHAKKHRIVPSMIKNSLKNDEEMHRMLHDVTIGMGE